MTQTQTKAMDALAMRIAGGDYEGIAEELKITRKVAEGHVDRELKKLLRPGEDTDLLDLARLGTMLLAVWPKVLEGDVKAIVVAHEIMVRKKNLEASAAPQEESELDKARNRRRDRLSK